MEDRHYLSEPRPVPGRPCPSWEVDILREGVDTPVMTLMIDNETLPPRKRKRKIVWQLPDSLDQMPKFGMEDKKRILELYKEKKKELRKLRKSNSLVQSNGNDDNEVEGSGPGPNAQKNGGNKSKTTKQPPENGSGTDKPKESLDSAKRVAPRPQPTGPQATGATSAPPPPPGFMNGHSPGMDQQQSPPPVSAASTIPRQSSVGPPPPPPPGLGGGISTSPQPQHQPNSSNGSSLRAFTVPNNGSTLAQVVSEMYYQFLAHGYVQELMLHYVPGAPKSLTVGGATHLCNTQQDCMVQLQSLSKQASYFLVKGLLQQPSVGGTVVVVITGVCTQPQPLPFCHTLVMIPRAEGAFQIQNDALVFMTTDN